MSLYCLVEHCGYGEMQNEMIRDRIVVGIQDAALSEKPQLVADLSLESAIAKVRQSELIKQQQPTVRGDEQKVEAISNKKGTQFRKRGNDPPNKLQRTYQTEGVRQRHVQDVGELDIVNNTVIALQSKQHAVNAKRRDTFEKCVGLRK